MSNKLHKEILYFLNNEIFQKCVEAEDINFINGVIFSPSLHLNWTDIKNFYELCYNAGLKWFIEGNDQFFKYLLDQLKTDIESSVGDIFKIDITTTLGNDLIIVAIGLIEGQDKILMLSFESSFKNCIEKFNNIVDKIENYINDHVENFKIIDLSMFKIN